MTLTKPSKSNRPTPVAHLTISSSQRQCHKSRITIYPTPDDVLVLQPPTSSALSSICLSVCPCINYLSLHSSLNIAFQIVHVAGRSLPCNLIQSLIALLFPPLPHRRTRLRYYGRTANEIRCMAISGDTDHIIGAFAHCT